MDKAGNEGETDHAEVNSHEAGIAIYPRQQDVADAGKKNRRHDDRTRAVAIDEMADQRRLDGALRARQRERQGGCGAAKPEILADGEKENGKAELMQPAKELELGAEPLDKKPSGS